MSAGRDLPVSELIRVRIKRNRDKEGIEAGGQAK